MLIAIKENDRVVVASLITDKLKRMSCNDFVNVDNRIVTIKDDTVYCFAMAGRYADMFLCDDKFFEFEVTPESIVKNFIPYMYQRIKQEKKLENTKWDDPNWENALVIVKGNRIFLVTPKFYFKEESEFICSGWDTDYIYGSLEATRGEKTEDRIRKAIELYECADRSNLYPFVVVDSSDLKIQIWER